MLRSKRKVKRQNEKTWVNCLKHLKDFTGGHIQFSAVNEEWLELFKSHLLSKVATNTANGYFSKIKCALRQAVKDKIIAMNPADLVDNIKPTESDRCYLNHDEIQKLANTECQYPEVKRAFLFACSTGLRLSDIEELERRNIHDDYVECRQKKTKNIVAVPLTETAKKLVHLGVDNAIPMPTNKVFNLPSRMTIYRFIKKWVKEAGIDKPVNFHTSRHSFATVGLTNGIDLYTMSKLLGHRNIAATQIYAKIVDDKLRKAVALMPSINIGEPVRSFV